MSDDRLKKIVDYVNQSGFASAEDLAEKLEISAITIRRDLAKLEKDRLITRVHGGAVPAKDGVVSQHLSWRMQTQIEAKETIARYAALLLGQGETLFLDAGSTCLCLARALPENRHLTVITHSLEAVNLLRGKMGIRVICAGGELEENLGAFIGPATEAALKPFYVDKAFISTAGITLEQGCINNTIAESSIKRTMYTQARKSYILADSSKFTVAGFYSILPLDQIGTVITDPGISESDVLKFRQKNIEILVAEKSPESLVVQKR